MVDSKEMPEGIGAPGQRRRPWSRSTERVAAILSYFSLQEPRVKAARLADGLGMHPSTVYRYLEALEAAHILERDGQSNSYQLGLRIVELSAVVLHDLDVRRHSLDEMDALQDKVGLLVNLGLLREADVVHVAHAFPPGWPRENMDIGRTAVAQATALGKVLLAALPWEEALARVLTAGWRPYTANSIVAESALKAELDEVRSSGRAIDREERHPGVMCIAVPIRSADGDTRAALSVTGRIGNVEGRVTELLADLSATAGRVSARLGGKGAYRIIDFL